MARVTVRPRGGASEITIRNGPYNLLDTGSTTELAGAISSTTADLLIIRGAGGNLSGGADIGMMYRLAMARDLTSLELFFRSLSRLEQTILASPLPMIAVVNGAAAGGGLGLVLLCDSVIATPGSFFRVGTTAIGLPPAMGMSRSIEYLTDAGTTARLLNDNPRIPSDEALGLGIVTTISIPEELEAAIDRDIERIGSDPPGTLRRRRIVPEDAESMFLEQEFQGLINGARQVGFPLALRTFLEDRGHKNI